jgi:hypothetical protein
MTTLALDDDLPEIPHARPVWLMTLADLALLLVGFFVFVQASQQLDRHALAKGMREGFGAHEAQSIEPMAVTAGAVAGFASGSATLPQSSDGLVAWAREATRDPRVTLRIAGSVDGSSYDVDPLTHSGAVLAADRARAVASLLLVAHAVPADRLTIVTATRASRRGVTVTTGFAGGRP